MIIAFTKTAVKKFGSSAGNGSSPVGMQNSLFYRQITSFENLGEHFKGEYQLFQNFTKTAVKIFLDSDPQTGIITFEHIGL